MTAALPRARNGSAIGAGPESGARPAIDWRPRRGCGWRRVATTAMLATLLGACAAVPTSEPLVIPDGLDRVATRSAQDVTVSASILSREQALRHFGVDLGAVGIQVAWLRVRNASPRKLWLIRPAIDPDIYTADEVALLLGRGPSAGERDRFDQRLRDEEIRSLLLPGMLTEGMLYLPQVEGGRFLDVRLSGDAWDEAALREDPRVEPPADVRLGFAIPLPDGEFDYEALDSRRQSERAQAPELSVAGLRQAIEGLPCCGADASGLAAGDPLNLVLVGDAETVLNALSRSGWSFTHRISLKTVRREIAAAIEGEPYPIAPVSALYLFGRPHDVALQRARRSIAQRNHLRLWLAPFRHAGREVWVGQVSRDIGIKLSVRSPTLTTHRIDPAVDVAREYLLQSLVATGLVDRFGFARGARGATVRDPAENLTGDPYFGDGLRLVVLVADDPIPPNRIRSLRWERSAAPIAEGQGESADRNVSPIDDRPPPR